MTNKKRAQGLGQPQDVGVNNLFDIEEDDLIVPNQTEDTEISVDVKSEVVIPDEQKKVKTSLSLTQETIDLLYDLKKVARKQKGKFVSQSELIDWAVKDLAAKMNVEVES